MESTDATSSAKNHGIGSNTGPRRRLFPNTSKSMVDANLDQLISPDSRSPSVAEPLHHSPASHEPHPKTLNAVTKIVSDAERCPRGACKSQCSEKAKQLARKYQPLLYNIDSRTKCRRESEETMDEVPSTIPKDNDDSSVAITNDDDVIDVFKEMSSFQSLISLKQAYSGDMTTDHEVKHDEVTVKVGYTDREAVNDDIADDRNVTNDIIRALPEVTKLMESVAVSSVIKRHIAESPSNLVATERVKLSHAKSKLMGSYSDTSIAAGDGADPEMLIFSDFYNVRVFNAETNPRKLQCELNPIHKYENLVSKVPAWFLDAFENGPVTVNLKRTFPIGAALRISAVEEDPNVLEEYTSLAKANVALTIDPLDTLVQIGRTFACKVRVDEHIKFTRDKSATSVRRSPSPQLTLINCIPGCNQMCGYRAKWRREYKSVFSGSEPCRRNRVAFSSSHVVKPSHYVLGKYCMPGWQKNFHLVFILTGSKGNRHICGTYHRQMSSSDKFMTWKFRIK